MDREQWSLTGHLAGMEWAIQILKWSEHFLFSAWEIDVWFTDYVIDHDGPWQCHVEAFTRILRKVQEGLNGSTTEH